MKPTSLKNIFKGLAMAITFSCGLTLSSTGSAQNMLSSSSASSASLSAPPQHRHHHHHRGGFMFGVCVGQTLAAQSIAVPSAQATHEVIHAAKVACRAKFKASHPQPSGSSSASGSASSSSNSVQ